MTSVLSTGGERQLIDIILIQASVRVREEVKVRGCCIPDVRDLNLLSQQPIRQEPSVRYTGDRHTEVVSGVPEEPHRGIISECDSGLSSGAIIHGKLSGHLVTDHSNERAGL